MGWLLYYYNKYIYTKEGWGKIGKSISKGVKSGVDWAAKAAKDAAKAAADAAKAALDALRELERWYNKLIDSMKNKEIGTFEVYRIQIFESSIASIARAEAKRFQNILGDTVYIDFETPLYKLRIGNYVVRKNAEKAIKSISRLGVKDSWIIRTKTIIEDWK